MAFTLHIGQTERLYGSSERFKHPFSFRNVCRRLQLQTWSLCC